MIAKIKLIVGGVIIGVILFLSIALFGALAELEKISDKLHNARAEYKALSATLDACNSGLDNVSKALSAREQLLKQQEKALNERIDSAYKKQASFVPIGSDNDSAQIAKIRGLVEEFLTE